MRARSWISSFGAAAVVAGGLAMAPAVPAAAADPPPAGITLDKKAPASVLLGDPVPYTLTASNPTGNAPLYNVSFSDVLPTGFEYAGPTDPLSAGEPTVTTTPGGQTLLVWNNVTDLQAASSFTLEFEAKPIPQTPPVDTIDPKDKNTAYVAGSINERKVPKFGPDGKPVPDADVTWTEDSTETARAPFKITKSSSKSPEGELLRGVHNQVAVYTLEIENNKNVDTNDVYVTDYLPAELEFLGCGNRDNSSGPEYPGAPQLGVSGVNPSPCPTPISVETVKNPTGIPGLGNLTGVYTAVTWNVGDLTAGDQPTIIEYAAGIPLFENTTNWPGGVTPDPTCSQNTKNCLQGSNLDNNTNTPSGSTRENIPEKSITNKVSATGTFTGTAPTLPGKPAGYVEVTEEHTVTIEDVRMQKKALTDTPPPAVADTFVPGQIVNFQFIIQASEYMTADEIKVTDTLPDGYCPLSLTTNYWPAKTDCDAGIRGPSVSINAGAVQPLGYTAGTQWNDATNLDPDLRNTYTVNLAQVSVLDNQTTTITLPARMLDEYRATNKPTVAGDSFENNVALTATTTPITGVDGDPEPVGDASRYTQGTPLPTISKEIKTRAAPSITFPNGMKCDPGVPPPYVSDPKPLPSFRKGDVICFKLRVDFPKTIDTKNAVVTDFPPVGTEFVVNNAPETGNNPFKLTVGVNNVTVAPVLTKDKIVLTLGDGGFVPRAACSRPPSRSGCWHRAPEPSPRSPATS